MKIDAEHNITSVHVRERIQVEFYISKNLIAKAFAHISPLDRGDNIACVLFTTITIAMS